MLLITGLVKVAHTQNCKKCIEAKTKFRNQCPCFMKYDLLDQTQVKRDLWQSYSRIPGRQQRKKCNNGDSDNKEIARRICFENRKKARQRFYR